MNNIYSSEPLHWLWRTLSLLALLVTATTAQAQTTTASPVVTTPNNSLTTGRPSYAGTAPTGSLVTVYVDGTSIGTTTTTAANGAFSLTQPANLADGRHQVYATAQINGQLVSANSNTNTFTSDAIPPTVVSVTRQSPATNPTNATSLIFRVTFSEAVTGAIGGIPYRTSTTGTTGGVIGGASYSSNVYDINVGNVSGNGTIGLTVRPFDTTLGVGITDLAGNRLNSGFFTGEAYTIDQTAPTVTSLTSPAGSSTSTSPIPFSVTFSENITALVASGITISNGLLASNTISGNGNGPYTFSVTPSSSGPVSVRIAANAAQDAAGNKNVISSTVSVAYTAPSTSTSWTGSMSTDWSTAGNWTAGVPTATLDAIIPSGTPYTPSITTQSALTRNLILNTGATLTMSGGTLYVQADFINNGNFVPTGGAVALGTLAQANGPNILGNTRTRFWNLVVNSNGVLLSTSAGASVRRQLALNGSLITQGNPFIVESDATGTGLVYNNGGDIVGQVTVQRYISPALNAGLGYRHFAAPVDGATVATLATGSFTPTVNDAYNTAATPGTVTAFPTVYGYDQSRLSTTTNNLSPFDKGWFSPSTLNDPLVVGQGYTVNLAAGQTVSFTGPQNNNDISVNLTRTASGSTNTANAGWALVGNPYPSPLNYAQVAAADRVGLDAAIYVFESTGPYTGSYRASLNGVGGNGNSPNPLLALGQAFFVRVSDGLTSGRLTFRNSQRVTSYVVNPSFLRTTETRPLVQLSLQGIGSTLVDDAYVYFEDSATNNFEPAFDAVKLPNSTGLNLSTRASTKQLAINGQSVLGTTQRVMPLTVGVPAAGSYTLSATQLLNLSTVLVYLRDLQSGALIDLAQQPSYQFTVSNASALITNRFELVFSPQRALATAPAALVQQVALYPNPATGRTLVELPASISRQAVTATLVDALGRQVRTLLLPAQGAVAHSVDLRELPTGVYTLRLDTGAGLVVKKLVVE